MSKKSFWSWSGIIGIILLIIGSLVAFIPIVGLPLIALGTIMFLISVIVLIPLLIKERSKDNKEMTDEISKEELRP